MRERARAGLIGAGLAPGRGHALLEKMNSQITASADIIKEWRKRGLGRKERGVRGWLAKSDKASAVSAVRNYGRLTGHRWWAK